VSALDRWQNEALPASTNGFFIADPLVPDYLPVPGLPLWSLVLLISLAGAAAELQRRRQV
jgi:hypothetical protein